MTLSVTAAAATDVGLVRQDNEDAYLVKPPLYAVADGMGGHLAGEVASALSMETLEAMVHLRGPDALADGVREANAAIYERQILDRALAGMGTTMTSTIVRDDALHLAHVGDSRAYLLRDGQLRQLTHDHTWVDEMIRTGEMTAEEGRNHPRRSMLTRALGIDRQVTVDETQVPLRDGDRVLLCSDGLTALLSDDPIADILRAREDTKTTADALIRAASNAGGVDNTTVVLLDFSEGAAPVPPPDEGDGTEQRAQTVAANQGFGGSFAGAQRGSRGKFHWRSPIVIIAIVVFVLAAVGIPLYAGSHWFVGIADGHVAIMRGLPASALGIDMFSVEQVTAIQVTTLEDAAPRLVASLEDGIPAVDRTDAEATVEMLQGMIDTNAEVEAPVEPPPAGTPSPSASPEPSP